MIEIINAIEKELALMDGLVSHLCPYELKEGNIEDYAKELLEMLQAFNQGKFQDITEEVL